MDILFEDLGTFLSDLDKKRDALLSPFIKKYWPRNITPNQLTVIRIIIGTFLFLLLFNFRIDNGLIVLPLFLVGILTDLLDGSIARCLHMETEFGMMVDPIADRIIIIPIAIYSLLSYDKLLLALILLLEIINGLLSLFGNGRKIFYGSNIFGKTKMFLQSVVFLAILVFWPRIPNPLFVYILWFSLVFMGISIFYKVSQLTSHYAKKYKSVQHTH